MASRNVEIIPPGRRDVRDAEDGMRELAVARLPELDGWLPSTATRWRADRRARTVQALTRAVEANRELIEAETRAIESRIKSHEAAERLAGVGEELERAATRRRIEHASQMRELQHREEISEIRRATERFQAEATLISAEHATTVQRERGYGLLAKRFSRDELDLDLAIAEREAVLKQHLAEMRQALRRSAASSSEARDAIEEALHQARAEMNAHGLNTSALDDVLERRRGEG